MKKKAKKVVLFLVEGASDLTSLEFIDLINNKDFKVLGDYKATWDFIKKDLNSVNRYSNFWLFFENLK